MEELQRPEARHAEYPKYFHLRTGWLNPNKHHRNNEALQMTESEYIEQRLEDQINWYSAKSSSCQTLHKALRLTEIVAAALIPLLSGMGEKVLHGPWIIGLLGAVIAIATAAGGLFKFHENWIQYRVTSEQLKHEKFLFLTRETPYVDDDRFQVLVQRVEGLISKENVTWTQSIKSEPKSSDEV